MLENSFSFLPVKETPGGESPWKLVSDLELARYLRTASNSNGRQSRLVQNLAEVHKAGHIHLRDTKNCGPEALISDLFKRCDGQNDWGGLPILVCNGSSDLIGILTPFDLL